MSEASFLGAALRRWREKRLAAARCASLLALHDAVSTGASDRSRHDTYGQVIMSHTGCDMGKARQLLGRAVESYASWPVDRELTFRDVVRFVVASELLAMDGSHSIEFDLKRLVDARIPANM